MLQIKQLSFDFSDKRLFDNLNFSLPQGALLHLQGANGAGKTTLLKLISGLISPLSGDICFDGQSIHQDLSAFQRNMCFVGHKMGVSPALTLRQNCQFDLQFGRRQVQWSAWLSQLALTEMEHIPCGLMSAGQKRRVALMRLLLTDARIWILDEPFVALDQVAIEFLKQHILNHLVGGGMVLLTSHQAIPFDAGCYLEFRI